MFRPNSLTNVCRIFKSLADIGTTIFRAFQLCQVQVPQPIKILLDIQISSCYHLQSILAQSPDHGPMNLTQGPYLNTPQEYVQQFSENVTIKFSQSKFCLIFKLSSWILEFPCSENSSSKSRSWTYQFDPGNLLEYPSRIFSAIFRNFTVKFRPHSLTNFCRIFKSPAGYWNSHVQRILAQNPDHGPINLIQVTYLNTPQEYVQHFSESFTVKFRPHSLTNVCRIFKSLADIGITIFREFQLKTQIKDLSVLFRELTCIILKNIFSNFRKCHSQVQVPQPIKVLLDIQISSYCHLQSILAQNPDCGPMNLTQGPYLNTLQEYVQQFSENVTIKFRPHSQSNICLIFKSLAGYWNSHVQRILAQNPDHGPINLIEVTYLNTPQEYFQNILPSSLGPTA